MLMFLPMFSSMNIRPPPAPQHMPSVPDRSASTISIPARLPMTFRGAVYTSLCRPR